MRCQLARATEQHTIRRAANEFRCPLMARSGRAGTQQPMSALGAKPDDICSLRAFERSSEAFTRLANRGLSH
jgi:hypothetical protein